ncbi:hypothetical protein AWB78_06488 [Caballeronia calidae]|uniref:Uncharacterized protein n=1 Tax=Caballeronia calidae TaxID=1777139 RepID=A0A158E843_9BURK|nr:hypothetical protein [Caballeronia calidae]SAL03042.1 hypothetical protein AWB78_06488 [Caballeronia calidae]
MDDEQKHPLQHVYVDDAGEPRFQKNAIVEYLLTHGSIRFDQILLMDFSLADREQIAQQLGYSVRGFSDLHWVSEEADRAAGSAAIYAIIESKKEGDTE